MEQNEIMALLAGLHNSLSQISVRGDDVIRMAQTLQTLRQAILQIQESVDSSGERAG